MGNSVSSVSRVTFVTLMEVEFEFESVDGDNMGSVSGLFGSGILSHGSGYSL